MADLKRFPPRDPNSVPDNELARAFLKARASIESDGQRYICWALGDLSLHGSSWPTQAPDRAARIVSKRLSVRGSSCDFRCYTLTAWFSAVNGPDAYQELFIEEGPKCWRKLRLEWLDDLIEEFS